MMSPRRVAREAGAAVASLGQTPRMDSARAWLVLGFFGQSLFFSRVLVQWLASERAGRSIVPAAFWWLSVGGSALLLSYAVARRDPVFIAGQAGGVLIYLRNLQLIAREKRAGR